MTNTKSLYEKVMEELKEGVEDFLREERIKKVESERELKTIFLM